MTLNEAVRRLTYLPAQQLHLQGRGIIRPGAFADIVVFDPQDIRSNCSIEEPRKYASGIAHVMVNGHLSFKNGQRIDVNKGKVLRRATL